MDKQELNDKAYAWRERNSGAWGYMVSLAIRETKAKRRFSADWLIQSARKRDFATDDGSKFAINNSYSPAFSRMLVKEYPECTPFIELRKSKLDEVS